MHDALKLLFFPSSFVFTTFPRLSNWYFWFWKSLNTADLTGGLSFFDIHLRINVTFDISTSVILMTTKYGKQVHVE